MPLPPAMTPCPLIPLALGALLTAQDGARLPPGLPGIAAAYAAKVAGTALFVSGRTLDSVLAEELAPDTPMFALVRPLLRIEVDGERRTVTARILGAAATAVYVDGLGCTLVRDVDPATLRQRALPPAPIAEAAAADRPWPLGEQLTALPLPADVDAKELDAALAFAFARAPERTRAVVVVRDGALLAERYAPGYDPRTPLPGWSMTKSVVDALVGLRVADGKLDPGMPLPVPEWQQPDDPRAALRLEHLLRMQTGLAWSEDYGAMDSDALQMLFASHDYAAVAAQQRLAEPPGTRRHYSSGTTNLLCRILRATFADDAAYYAFPRDRLFLPLGMQSARIETDPSGTFVGSSFGVATARDWAKFGLFYLQDGCWDGRRLLPVGWVRASTTPDAVGPHHGRHWHLNTEHPTTHARPYPELPADLFSMSGYEGQYVVCLPAQRLVVVRLGCTRRGEFPLGAFVRRVIAACGG